MTHNDKESDEAETDIWYGKLSEKLNGKIIFKEGLTIFAVRIKNVLRTKEHLFLDVVSYPVNGFQYHDPFRISCQIDVVRKQTGNYWYVPYVGWSLYLDPKVVDQAVSILSEVPSGKNYLSEESVMTKLLSFLEEVARNS